MTNLMSRTAHRTKTFCQRAVLVVCALAIVALTSACLDDDTIELVFVNNTPDRLCFDLGPPSADFCDEVKPNTTTIWRPECSGNQSLPVTLTVGQGGDLIYESAATCNEWTESGGEITIDFRNGSYSVTDSLPGS